jgi:7,8-dihydropterin-6-yl-methyl-4-(beta-D-ribofuranosyl)aminobenzene 5'-phosphate synthase
MATDTSLPPTSTLLPSATLTEDSAHNLQITIVYDNYPYQAGLRVAWGFSAYITYQNENILFDTGGSGTYLLANMASLDIFPEGIQHVVLSHEHSDHTGGLFSLLQAGADPIVYIPPSFSYRFKNLYEDRTQLVEVRPGLDITDWAYSLGEYYGPPPEQALVINTPAGVVIITGCAHPGVGELVMAAKQQFQKEIYLVMGGFHLVDANDGRINQIIEVFHAAGVQYVAPSHCTGDHAIDLFQDAFGERFIPVGVGAVITIDN